MTAMYNVINRNTGTIVSKNLKSKDAARKARDRHDNKYGAYVHSIQAVVAAGYESPSCKPLKYGQ